MERIDERHASLGGLAVPADAMAAVDSALARAERIVDHLPSSPAERRLRAALALYRRTANVWRQGIPTVKQILALRYVISEVIDEAQDELPDLPMPAMDES